MKSLGFLLSSIWFKLLLVILFKLFPKIFMALFPNLFPCWRFKLSSDKFSPILSPFKFMPFPSSFFGIPSRGLFELKLRGEIWLLLWGVIFKLLILEAPVLLVFEFMEPKLVFMLILLRLLLRTLLFILRLLFE